MGIRDFLKLRDPGGGGGWVDGSLPSPEGGGSGRLGTSGVVHYFWRIAKQFFELSPKIGFPDPPSGAPKKWVGGSRPLGPKKHL